MNKNCRKCPLHYDNSFGLACPGDSGCVDVLLELYKRFRASMNLADLELKEQQELMEAAIADLEDLSSCSTCANLNAYCESNECMGYKWRGIQDGENSTDKADKAISERRIRGSVEDEVLHYTQEFVNKILSLVKENYSEKPAARSYMDILMELQDTIKSDTAIPEKDRQSINDLVNFLQSKLFKYSD